MNTIYFYPAHNIDAEVASILGCQGGNGIRCAVQMDSTAQTIHHELLKLEKAGVTAANIVAVGFTIEQVMLATLIERFNPNNFAFMLYENSWVYPQKFMDSHPSVKVVKPSTYFDEDQKPYTDSLTAAMVDSKVHDSEGLSEYDVIGKHYNLAKAVSMWYPDFKERWYHESDGFSDGEKKLSHAERDNFLVWNYRSGYLPTEENPIPETGYTQEARNRVSVLCDQMTSTMKQVLIPWKKGLLNEAYRTTSVVNVKQENVMDAVRRLRYVYNRGIVQAKIPGNSTKYLTVLFSDDKNIIRGFCEHYHVATYFRECNNTIVFTMDHLI